MFSLFKSVVELVEDVATVAVAPVEVVVDLASAAIKPMAEAAKEITNDIKHLKD